MQHGDILLLSSWTILGWLQRFFKKQDYNHIGIVSDGFFYSASKEGIFCQPLYDVLAKYRNVKKIRCKISGYNSAACTFVKALPTFKARKWYNQYIFTPIYFIFGVYFGSTHAIKLKPVEFIARCYDDFFSNPEQATVKELLTNPDFNVTD